MENKESIRESVKEISLVDMWNVFKKAWVFILITAILAGGIAFAYVNFLVEPEYSSTARFYVYYNSSSSSGNVANGPSSFDMTMARTLVGTYSEMLVDNHVVDEIKASEREFSNLSRGQIKNMITITPNPDEMIITVSVTHTDPELAYSIVDTIMTDGIAEVDRILASSNQSDNGISVIDPPEIAKAPNSNRLLMKTAIVAFVGAVACFAIFFAKSMFDYRVHSEDDLESHFDAPILSGIPIIYQENKRNS